MKWIWGDKMPTWEDMNAVYDKMKGAQLFRKWDYDDTAGRIMTILVLARCRRRAGMSSSFRNVMAYYADWKKLDYYELEYDIKTYVRKCGYFEAFDFLEGLID